jgi:K+-transporting ATPase KdpF subunit
LENLIVGLVAAALIIYLFVVLLRPHKFYGLLPEYVLMNQICSLPYGRAAILERRFRSSRPSGNSLYC